MGIALDVLCQTLDVDFVQCRLNLVQNAERCGVDLNGCKEQGDTNECLLTTRELHQVLDDFAGRCGFDLDSALEYVLGIGQRQFGGATAKELGKYLAEVLVDLVKGINEGCLHFNLKLADDAVELLACGFEVVDLRTHIVVAHLYFFVLVDSVKVNVTDNTQLVAALGLQCHQLCAVLLGNGRIAKGYGIGTRQFVIIPKLCSKLILRVTQIEKLCLALGVLTEDELLVVHTVAQLCIELVELALELEIILFHRAALFVQVLKLCGSRSVVGTVLFHSLGGLSDLLFLGIDAPRKSHLFLVEGLDSLFGCGFEHGCRINILLVFANADIELGQALGDLIEAQNDLAAFGVLFRTEIGQLTNAVTKRFCLGCECFDVLFVFDLCIFILLHIGAELGKQGIVCVLFGAELVELGVLGVAENGNQLATVLCGVLFVLGILYLFGQSCNLCLELFNGCLTLGKLGFETLDLACTGEDAATCANGTARKGTACIDLLTVERDNAHAIVQSLCHNAGVLDVIKHNDSAKQRGKDLAEFLFGIYKAIGNTDIPFKACRLGNLLGGLARLHRGQREEGRSACLAALEGVHCRLCGGFILNDDVLQICAKSDLNSGQVFIVYGNDLGKRPIDSSAGCTVYVGDLPLGVLLHNVANGVGISFKVLLHGFEGGNSLSNRIATEGLVVQLCGAGFERCGSIGKRLLVLGDLAINACDLCIVIGNRALLDSALLGQLIRNFAVAFKLGQCRTVFIGIGILCILQNRDANLNVNGFVLECANILKGLRYVCLELICLGSQVCLLKGKLVLLLGELFTARLQISNVCGVLGASLHFVLQSLFGAAYTSLRCGNELFCVRDGVLGYAIFALKRVAKLGLLADLGQELLRLFFAALRSLEQLCVLRFKRLDSILCHLQIEGCMLHCLLGSGKLVVQLFGIIEPQTDVGTLFVLHQLDRLFGFFGFLLQRPYLCRYLKEDIVGAGHIVLGCLELSFCLVLFIAVFCNTRSILKHATALLAFTGYHFGNTALTDDGVTVTANTRIHKELIDILETNALAVDKIFTVARAIVTAGNRNLIVGAIQFCKVSAVIEGDRYLGVSHGATAIRTAKDYVLHFATTQALGRDLTKYPTHSVGNI